MVALHLAAKPHGHTAKRHLAPFAWANLQEWNKCAAPRNLPVAVISFIPGACRHGYWSIHLVPFVDTKWSLHLPHSHLALRPTFLHLWSSRDFNECWSTVGGHFRSFVFTLYVGRSTTHAFTFASNVIKLLFHHYHYRIVLSKILLFCFVQVYKRACA